ncbi:MAG: hypothetical protein QOH88_1685 [Verrucomicrobiota bacterium]|jgi:hypothetical protein
MAHDVFISHSSRDKPVADAVCAALENAGIRCWVAPRDVQPGRSFAGEITRAIQQGKAMVLIFSANSNTSSQVLREVQLAVDSQLHILQFRIEEVLLNDDLKYYLSTPHWLDAMTPPLENHLDRLASSLKTLLGKAGAQTAIASEERNRTAPATGREEPPPSVPPGGAPGDSSSRRVRIPLLVGAALLGGIGLFLLRDRVLPQRIVAPGSSPTASATPAPSPAPSIIASFPPSQAFPIPSAKKKKLFSHNFETAAPIARPLFGPNAMSVQNANGEGQITAKSAGILPAMFDELVLDDFIVECGMRAETAPPGARYGFIFRAAEVENGGIARYYALLLDPNKNIAQMRWWTDGRWMMNPERPVPSGLLKVGRKSRITLEAVANQFRVFINDRFATEFSMDGLTIGRLGLCLSTADSTPWAVYFDNLQVYLPPSKESNDSSSTAASSPSIPATAKPFDQSWDFSGGMLPGIRTEGVEVVEASGKTAGGEHLRFLHGGRSFLEATFDFPGDAAPPTRLMVRHLSSSPDGKQAGYSPVRITLNGNEIFRGSPAEIDWIEDKIDPGNYVQPGRNTLRWEYLDGAQTHYWLKSFRLSGGNR